jgi:hypothetical protein
LLRLEQMWSRWSRYLYLAAAAGFLAGAVVEFLPPHNLAAAMLDAAAAVIFLFLGWGARRAKL